MNELSIGQVSRQTSIPASTIRYYEQIGLLPPPKRVSGQRRYTPEVLQRLELIRFAKDGGLAIKEIHALLQGFPTETPAHARWQWIATPRLAEIDQQIAQLQSMREHLSRTLLCACTSLLDCAHESSAPPTR